MSELQSKCPKCKEDIQDGAKKCKHCGSDLRNWFVKHKIFTTLLVLILLGIIVGANSKPKTVTNNDTGTAPGAQDVNNKVTKEKCDQVKTGMSGDQVKTILGEPRSASESETSGIGKSELWQFQESLSLQGCTVILLNNKVSSKTWTDLNR